MPFSISKEQLRRDILRDNYKNPKNFGKVDDPRYVTIHRASASCIDDIYIQLLREGDIIKDCRWYGVGCAVSTAASSVRTELVIGKTKEEANHIRDEYNKRLAGEHFDEDEIGEGRAFENVSNQPSRITCANISWRGLKTAFAEEEEKEHGCKTEK